MQGHACEYRRACRVDIQRGALRLLLLVRQERGP